MFKEYRIKNNLSWEDLSRVAKVSVKTIKRIETDSNYKPQLKTIKKLIKALDIKDEDILKYLKR